jgi:hypothetical protein
VLASGGVLQRVTNVDAANGETRHLALQFLPDGRRFLYLAGSNAVGRSMLYVGSLDSAKRTAIMPAPSNVQFAERPGGAGAGYLVYAADSLLHATGFNWKALKTGADRMVLGESVTGSPAMDAAVSMANFSVAGNALAAQPQGHERNRITLLKNWMSAISATN